MIILAPSCSTTYHGRLFIQDVPNSYSAQNKGWKLVGHFSKELYYRISVHYIYPTKLEFAVIY